MCEICSNLTKEIQRQSHRGCSGAFAVNYEQISHFVLMFLLLTLSKLMWNGHHRKMLFQYNNYLRKSLISLKYLQCTQGFSMKLRYRCLCCSIPFFSFILLFSLFICYKNELPCRFNSYHKRTFFFQRIKNFHPAQFYMLLAICR